MILKEFKDKLLEYPDDLEVVIEDVDTSWFLRLSNIKRENKLLILYADYVYVIKD